MLSKAHGFVAYFSRFQPWKHGQQLAAAVSNALSAGCQYSSATLPSPTRLSEVMQMDLLQGTNAVELTDIWLKFHESKVGQVGRVMSTRDWSIFAERSKRSPLFVLPLAKPGGGYLTLLTQCQDHLTLMTSLEEYRRFKEGAPPHLVVTHYAELAESHGLVLVRGDIINDQIISAAEAPSLMHLVHSIYTTPDAYDFVEKMNHQPGAFDFEAFRKRVGPNNEWITT